MNEKENKSKVQAGDGDGIISLSFDQSSFKCMNTFLSVGEKLLRRLNAKKNRNSSSPPKDNLIGLPDVHHLEIYIFSAT